MELLYHCSPTAGITELQPHKPEFFDKPGRVCLTALRPMALLYGVKHFEYTYGYTRDKEIYYEECFPDALREIYSGKAASLYTCCKREDMEPTRIPNELVTELPVPVVEEIRIPDVYEALLEEERAGRLRIIRWAERSEQSLANYRKMEIDVILKNGLLGQDSPFARYMREKYPDSWALAQAVTDEEASV